MPLYNAGSYLAEAIESILRQTLSDFEFVLLDDGSKDGSRQTAERFAQRDPRMVVISRENRGIVVTRNELIARASAPKLAWLDHDDVALPDRLAKQAAFMDVNPGCVIVGSRVLFIDADGDPLREEATELTHEEIDASHIAGRVVLFQTASMMSTAALRDIGGYRKDFELAEDYDVYFRMAEKGTLANLKDVLTKHRQHVSSAGHQATDRQLRAADAAINAARSARGLPPFTRQAQVQGHQLTLAKQHLIWSWWALASGYKDSARKHAFEAARRAPLNTEAWHALYCSVRGH